MMKPILVAVSLGLAAAQAAHAEIKIAGKNEQTTSVQGAVLNAALGAAARAKQSLASNVGKVDIQGENKQTVTVQGAVLNAALGVAAQADQALSSNVGE